MILNSRDNYAAFPIFSLLYFQKKMKNSYLVRILCVTRIYLSESKNNVSSSRLNLLISIERYSTARESILR